MHSRLRMFACVVVVVAMAVLGLETTAFAVATLPVDCSHAPAPGATILRPGAYVLGADVTNCNTIVGISIRASNVSLDLGGFTLDGGPAQTGISVDVLATKVRIFNGKIQQFAEGVNFNLAKKSSVSRVSINSATSDGILGVDGNTYSGNALSNSTDGIDAGAHNVIQGNTFHSDSTSISAGSHNVISKNSVSNAGGIAATDFNRIVNNSVAKAGAGLALGSNNLVSGNSISNVSDTGIAAIKDNTIRNNIVATAPVGISVTTGNVLSANVVTGTTSGRGIDAGDSNTFRNNRVDGSKTDGIKSGTASVLIGNHVSSSGDDGILLTAVATITNATLNGNTTGASGKNGISLSAVDASVLVTKNTADSNTLQGIHVAGATAPRKPQSNDAQNNGTVLQCDFNLCRTPV